MSLDPQELPSSAGLRPRDLAELLLASRDLLPRQRARDQQADLAGLKLKRLLLERIMVHDPDAEELEAALVRVVEELGPPTGPSRALALSFREEWQAACTTPEWIAQLLAEAVRDNPEDQPYGRRHRR